MDVTVPHTPKLSMRKLGSTFTEAAALGRDSVSERRERTECCALQEQSLRRRSKPAHTQPSPHPRQVAEGAMRPKPTGLQNSCRSPPATGPLAHILRPGRPEAWSRANHLPTLQDSRVQRQRETES